MNTKLYDRLGVIVRPLYKLLWPRSRVTGLENIPSEGGVILCCNHMHWNDCIYLAAKVEHRKISYLAKSELFSHKLLGKLIGENGLGAIAIHRGESDLAAMRASMNALKEGKVLGIFPQGTRSKDNTPTPLLNGVSMIALRSNAPIIPVYIDGPYKLFHRVDLRVGKPVEIADLGKRPDAATMNAITERIANAIWGMADARE